MVQSGQDIGGAAPYHDGDSLEIIIDVTEDGGAKDLSAASVSWTLARQPGAAAVLSGSDSGVDVSITDATQGEITVTIDSGVTDGLIGRFVHEVRVTDQNNETAVVTEGAFVIDDRVTP